MMRRDTDNIQVIPPYSKGVANVVDQAIDNGLSLEEIGTLIEQIPTLSCL